jgi:Mg2+/Co2+ transporter CorB
MKTFLVLASYQPKTWATLVKEPKNRLDVANPIIKTLVEKLLVPIYCLVNMIQWQLLIYLMMSLQPHFPWHYWPVAPLKQ